MKSIDYNVVNVHRSYIPDGIDQSQNRVAASALKRNGFYPQDVVSINRFEKHNMRSSDGRLIELTYSPYDRKVSAEIVTTNGHIKVENENLPKELRKIDDPKVFHAFLKDTHARISTLSDGASKIYLSHKLLGGGEMEDIVKKAYDCGYTDPFKSEDFNYVKSKLKEKGYDVKDDKIRELMQDASYNSQYQKAESNKKNCEKNDTPYVGATRMKGTALSIGYGVGGGATLGGAIGYGAYQCAIVGSTGGPVGAAIGGAIGGVVGLFVGLFNA